MWKLARALVAAAALAGPLGVAGVAGAAQLALEHQSLSVVEESPANGIVSAGDTIALTETVLSSESEPLTGLSGVLSTTTANVSLPDSSSPFADVAFGQTTANATPFRATLGAGVECGQNVGFSLALSTGPDSATIPFEVPTGAADAPVVRNSTDVPHVIPNPGVLQSSLTVGTAGRVKDVRVRIGRLRHPYVQDLRITLVSPAGTRVLLFDSYGGSGDDLVDTVFATVGASLAGGAAPFTGTWAAPGDLSRLEGEQALGTWKLEVTDTTPSDAGTLEAWGTDVRPATCAPRPIAVVDATPNPAGVGTTVTFDATQSIDPTGTIVMHEWDLDGDGSFETATGAVATVPHTYGAKQRVDAGLRITNNHGESSEARVTVRVTEPPTAAFDWTPVTPVSGEDLTLDGAASSDADGSIVHYAWDLDADGVFDTGGSQPTAVTSFATPGDKTVRLRVTDDTGATHTTARTITIANRSPDAAFSAPAPAVVGEPAVMDMSASGDLDGFLIEQAWDFDDDGQYDDYVQSVPAPSPAAPVFATPGEHVVRLQVRDDQGATATASRTVVVTHRPSAALVATPNPARPTKPVELTAAGSTDADGSIVRYEWDLDDDGTFEVDGGGSPLRSRTFGAPTTATIRVRVTDDKGASDVETLALPVVNDMPIARLVAVPGQATAGVPVVLDASTSADPDGSLTAYTWDLDGNGSYETGTGLVPAVTRTFPNPGTITVRVRVSDDEAGSGTASLPLTVVAPPATGGGGDGSGGGGGGAPGGGGAVPGGGGSLPGLGSVPDGGSEPGGGGSGTGIAPGGAFTAALDGAAVQKLKTVLKRGVVVRCKADREAVCRVRAEILPSDVKRLRLARGSKARRAMAVSKPSSVAAGRDVRLKLSARLRRALQRRGARSVTVVVRGEALAGGGRKVSLARAVLVRR